MTGVLDGVTVLDLSSGVAGPIAGMLLADNGAAVTRVLPPAGDPFAQLSGSRVWSRGKRPITVDLMVDAERDRFLGLAGRADVVLESFRPGVAERLGIDHTVLRGLNERLVHCSITAYGSSGSLADRPGYDALVTARTGAIWETRGVPGTTPLRLAGIDDPIDGVPSPPGSRTGPDRDGPLFPGVPWTSLGSAYLATLGVSAALRAREVTGRGQRVETSLLQGVLATTVFCWQRTEDAASDYTSWVIDPRSAKGILRCSDGRWIHQWTPLPSFFLESTHGDRLERTDEVRAPRNATARIGIDLHETVALGAFHEPMAEAAARFSSDEWTAFAAEVGVPLQPVRSPEEALDDPAFLADGCVVELPDRELGGVRQVGEVYRLSACPRSGDGPGPAGGGTRSTTTGELSAPLDGVVVVELGLAIAAPFTTQLLAELGATVVKVQQHHDGYWMKTHFAMACNRGKRSLALDMTRSEGRDAFDRLVERADVLVTNMRRPALERLGADDVTLRGRHPRLVYCHIRGFDRGARDRSPGVDQTGAALAGTEWLDGALDAGGRPVWALTSLGDTGSGFLGAIGVAQALWHRDRTGEGQVVDTSIVYAHLLNASAGAGLRLDRQHLGWGPRYRLYRTADDWLCVAAVTADHWRGLKAAVGRPDLADDERGAAELEQIFASASSSTWWKVLNDAGVPAEVAAPDAVRALFDDAGLRDRGWITTYDHASRGRTEAAGHLIDFSETPGVLDLPSPLAGQHSIEILGELGYDPAEIAALVGSGVVLDGSA
ncbi:MAG TPA: CoA transferase [Acidimicrobiales bacterium]|nr:CoA transferase [Acidimicrobiales bacterium]